MDEDRLTLIRELCTRAGMVLEDAATTAILIASVPETGLTVTLAGLHAMALRAAVLLEAAKALGE